MGKFAVVQFFVDLPVNDPSQTPKDLKLVEQPSDMLSANAQLYGVKETSMDYRHEGVEGAAGMDGDTAWDYISAMSESGLSQEGIKNALGNVMGITGGDIVDIVSDFLRAGSDPVKLGIAA